MRKTAIAVWDFIDRTARAVVDSLLRVIGKSITDEQWAAFMQFVKFGLVGAMNTGVDYAVYLLTLWIFTATGLFGEKAYYVSKILGFYVGFINMFYWNNKYVFKKKEGETRSTWVSFIKLLASYSVTGIGINSLCMYLLVDVMHFSKVLAPIPIMVITIPTNFLLSKLWAFRGKRNDNGQIQTELSDK